MRLYMEEAQGLDGPEKISTRWPACCHVTYHVHVAEPKRLPKYPPYQHFIYPTAAGPARTNFSLAIAHAIARSKGLLPKEPDCIAAVANPYADSENE